MANEEYEIKIKLFKDKTNIPHEESKYEAISSLNK